MRATHSQNRLRRDAMQIFRAALKAADAGNAVHEHLRCTSSYLKVRDVRLPLRNFDRIFLIAAGKAAVPMAAAVQKLMPVPLSDGIIVTKYGHATSVLRGLRVKEAGHPVPDEHGLEAAQSVRALLNEMNARDLLLVAISGGASALLPAPVETVTLRDKQRTTQLLLQAGASIHEMNAVRKHLSTLKGGRLAALAYPATVVSLLLSDVIGDDPDVIGSGPTVADLSTFADALSILEKYGLLRKAPVAVRKYLQSGAAGEWAETPKPGDLLFENVHNVVVGSNRLALLAAQKAAKALGYRTLILSSSMQGEAREVARVHSQILREVIASSHPITAPACILSGGETTVTVRGPGKGGRNQEFALTAAIELRGVPNALLLSAGTDGTDGPTDAAGAIVDGGTLERAYRKGLDGREYLERNDSYAFFEQIGDLIKTGPTGTNVMDVHLLLAG